MPANTAGNRAPLHNAEEPGDVHGGGANSNSHFVQPQGRLCAICLPGKKKHQNRLSLNAKLHTTKNEVQWDMGETVVPGDSFQSLQSVAC